MAYKLINTLSISASVSASNELFADQFESYDSLTIFSPASFNAPVYVQANWSGSTGTGSFTSGWKYVSDMFRGTDVILSASRVTTIPLNGAASYRLIDAATQSITPYFVTIVTRKLVSTVIPTN